ncbi:hypothetical protein QUB56_22020 [Microcoleus sp. AR_TQ3_B6]|uniref:hypothetical protein n=1 Tax=Microcoleus sp. AR_TQ3_B6 TaxID=3055284 RepID=UPI002FD2419D
MLELKKERSPLAPNTKHCDDSTSGDRPITHKERSMSATKSINVSFNSLQIL